MMKLLPLLLTPLKPLLIDMILVLQTTRSCYSKKQTKKEIKKEDIMTLQQTQLLFLGGAPLFLARRRIRTESLGKPTKILSCDRRKNSFAPSTNIGGPMPDFVAHKAKERDRRVVIDDVTQRNSEICGEVFTKSTGARP